MFPPISEFLKLLQSALVPLVFISAAGLLLLTMTNRFGRVIDLIRNSVEKLQGSPADIAMKKQLGILYSRAKIIRAGIYCLISSMFCASLLAVIIFLSNFYDKFYYWAIAVTVPAMVLLVLSLVFF